MKILRFFYIVNKTKVNFKKSKPNLYLKNKINKISGNVLVIGGSNGLAENYVNYFILIEKLK